MKDMVKLIGGIVAAVTAIIGIGLFAGTLRSDVVNQGRRTDRVELDLRDIRDDIKSMDTKFDKMQEVLYRLETLLKE